MQVDVNGDSELWVEELVPECYRVRQGNDRGSDTGIRGDRNGGDISGRFWEVHW